MNDMNARSLAQKNIGSNAELPDGFIACTIYDCEFDVYLAGVISSNTVLVDRGNGNFIPAKDVICSYVDFGMVQFITGNFEMSSGSPGKGSKWGYFKLETGEIKITSQYDYAGPFYGELARVIQNGKIGFIDPYGKITINLIWDEVVTGKSHRRLVDLDWIEESDPWVVRKGRKWGYINESGKIIIPLIYDLASKFKEDRAEVKIGEKYGFINRTGELIIQADYDETEFFRSVGIDKTQSHQIARVKKDGKYGFIDAAGNHITECIFDDAFEFWDIGYTGVKLNNKWSLIDQTGKFVSLQKFDDIGSYYGSINNQTFAKRRWGTEKMGYWQQSLGNTNLKDVYITVELNNFWWILDLEFNLFMPDKNNRYVEFKGKRIFIKNGDVTSMRKIKT